MTRRDGTLGYSIVAVLQLLACQVLLPLSADRDVHSALPEARPPPRPHAPGEKANKDLEEEPGGRFANKIRQANADKQQAGAPESPLEELRDAFQEEQVQGSQEDKPPAGQAQGSQEDEELEAAEREAAARKIQAAGRERAAKKKKEASDREAAKKDEAARKIQAAQRQRAANQDGEPDVKKKDTKEQAADRVKNLEAQMAQLAKATADKTNKDSKKEAANDIGGNSSKGNNETAIERVVREEAQLEQGKEERPEGLKGEEAKNETGANSSTDTDKKAAIKRVEDEEAQFARESNNDSKDEAGKQLQTQVAEIAKELGHLDNNDRDNDDLVRDDQADQANDDLGTKSGTGEANAASKSNTTPEANREANMDPEKAAEVIRQALLKYIDSTAYKQRMEEKEQAAAVIRKELRNYIKVLEAKATAQKRLTEKQEDEAATLIQQAVRKRLEEGKEKLSKDKEDAAARVIQRQVKKSLEEKKSMEELSQTVQDAVENSLQGLATGDEDKDQACSNAAGHYRGVGTPNNRETTASCEWGGADIVVTQTGCKATARIGPQEESAQIDGNKVVVFFEIPGNRSWKVTGDVHDSYISWSDGCTWQKAGDNETQENQSSVGSMDSSQGARAEVNETLIREEKEKKKLQEALDARKEEEIKEAEKRKEEEKQDQEKQKTLEDALHRLEYQDAKEREEEKQKAEQAKKRELDLEETLKSVENKEEDEQKREAEKEKDEKKKEEEKKKVDKLEQELTIMENNVEQAKTEERNEDNQEKKEEKNLEEKLEEQTKKLADEKSQEEREERKKEKEDEEEKKLEDKLQEQTKKLEDERIQEEREEQKKEKEDEEEKKLEDKLQEQTQKLEDERIQQEREEQKKAKEEEEKKKQEKEASEREAAEKEEAAQKIQAAARQRAKEKDDAARTIQSAQRQRTANQEKVVEDKGFSNLKAVQDAVNNLIARPTVQKARQILEEAVKMLEMPSNFAKVTQAASEANAQNRKVEELVAPVINETLEPLMVKEGLRPNFFVFSSVLVNNNEFLDDEGIRSALKKIDAVLGGDLSAFTKEAPMETQDQEKAAKIIQKEFRSYMDSRASKNCLDASGRYRGGGTPLESPAELCDSSSDIVVTQTECNLTASSAAAWWHPQVTLPIVGNQVLAMNNKKGQDIIGVVSDSGITWSDGCTWRKGKFEELQGEEEKGEQKTEEKVVEDKGLSKLKAQATASVQDAVNKNLMTIPVPGKARQILEEAVRMLEMPSNFAKIAQAVAEANEQSRKVEELVAPVINETLEPLMVKEGLMLSMNEGLQPNFFVFSTLLVSNDRYLRDEGIRSSLEKIDAALGGDLSAFTKQADEEGKKKPTKEEEEAAARVIQQQAKKMLGDADKQGSALGSGSPGTSQGATEVRQAIWEKPGGSQFCDTFSHHMEELGQDSPIYVETNTKSSFWWMYIGCPIVPETSDVRGSLLITVAASSESAVMYIKPYEDLMRNDTNSSFTLELGTAKDQKEIYQQLQMDGQALMTPPELQGKNCKLTARYYDVPVPKGEVLSNTGNWPTRKDILPVLQCCEGPGPCDESNVVLTKRFI